MFWALLLCWRRLRRVEQQQPNKHRNVSSHVWSRCWFEKRLFCFYPSKYDPAPKLVLTQPLFCLEPLWGLYLVERSNAVWIELSQKPPKAQWHTRVISTCTRGRRTENRKRSQCPACETSSGFVCLLVTTWSQCLRMCTLMLSSRCCS